MPWVPVAPAPPHTQNDINALALPHINKIYFNSTHCQKRISLYNLEFNKLFFFMNWVRVSFFIHCVCVCCNTNSDTVNWRIYFFELILYERVSHLNDKSYRRIKKNISKQQHKVADTSLQTLFIGAIKLKFVALPWKNLIVKKLYSFSSVKRIRPLLRRSASCTRVVLKRCIYFSMDALNWTMIRIHKHTNYKFIKELSCTCADKLAPLYILRCKA